MSGEGPRIDSDCFGCYYGSEDNNGKIVMCVQKTKIVESAFNLQMGYIYIS